MVEISALTFTLLSEGVVVLSLILIIMIVMIVKRKSRDRAAAKMLIEHIKSTADQRIEAIKMFLQNKAGLESDELHAETKKIDRKEKDFFTHIVRLYIKKDVSLLQKMDESFDQVLDEYRSKGEDQKGGNSDAQNDENAAQIEQLIEEKEKLEMELSITKQTMSGMMSEFNNMFNGGNGGGDSEQAKQLQEALTNEAGDPTAPRSISEMNNEDDDIAFEEATLDEETLEDDNVNLEEMNVNEQQEVAQTEETANSEETEKTVSQSDIDDDIFGDIVSTEDVDDLLDGIDLSEDIDNK